MHGSCSVSSRSNGCRVLFLNLPCATAGSLIGHQRGWLLGWRVEHAVLPLYVGAKSTSPIQFLSLSLGVTIPATVGLRISLFLYSVAISGIK